MTRSLGALLAMALVTAPVRADDKDATPILDKAIKALGGEPALAKAAASASWTVKGKITFNDSENEFTTRATAKGTDHLREEFSGEFNGTQIQGVRVVAGDKAWMKFNDEVRDLDGDAVAHEKRNLYLQAVPITILPLKGKGFKAEADGEESVDGKPAAKVKATGPDGSTFTLFFDKGTGLPVKQVGTAFGWQGNEYTQEASFGDYKELGGIKKATRISSKRDGEKFMELTITEFQPLDKVPADTFAEPR
jgi:hypothetical protein